MNKPKFITQQRRLTQYALSCGYIETAESRDQQTYVKLWREHGVYFVRITTSSGRTTLPYVSIDRARQRFDQMCTYHSCSKHPLPPEPV